MNGNIYKIIVNCSNEIYVGSTTQECRRRWQDHVQDYKKWKNGYRKNSTSSFELFEKHGIDNCKIILIRQYKIVDKDHLHALEQLWINKLKPINKNNPFCIPDLSKKIYQSKYYQKVVANDPEWHKKQYQKELERDPEHNKKKHLRRIKNNPNYNQEQYQKTLARNPNYHIQQYEKYGEKANQRKLEKITCDCGAIVSRGSLKIHQNSKRHQLNLLTPNEDQIICCGVLLLKKNLSVHIKGKKHRQLMGQPENENKLKTYKHLRVICDCGLEVMGKSNSIARHKKTKKHQKLMEQQQQQQ